MARQRQYDAVAAQEGLTDLFWRKGYAETSLTDMEAASGLNRRQLYNGIGDKTAMFVRSMDMFADIAGRRFLAPLEAAEASLGDIRGLLQTFVDMAGGDDALRGCMVCTASQEDISYDKAVAERIDAYFERIRSAYRNALERSVERGEIALTPEAIDLRVDDLFATHVAVCVLARARRPKDQLQRMVDQALKDLLA